MSEYAYGNRQPENTPDENEEMALMSLEYIVENMSLDMRATEKKRLLNEISDREQVLNAIDRVCNKEGVSIVLDEEWE